MPYRPGAVDEAPHPHSPGLQVEPVRAVLEREGLADAEPGGEQEPNERAAEAAL